ncbi:MULTISPECIES: dethiobiotin synthase [Paenibacillus]|uniref:dethiobiotin synthase n=1 Tax=Paenibacillus TaxID=44249 RepID=UPI0022B8B00D|nr:dethiobiotin synthase [Paenibacillus caseinilyticus]MCZ8523063.1 dethiobiotin synthase [Paenibacillus caseinilyticus]
MGKGLFVTGTDTEVGKTWVTSALAAAIVQRLQPDKDRDNVRRSIPLGIWKPVQSGTSLEDPKSDSARLVRGSGVEQTETETVSITLLAPLAPWMAAVHENKYISWDELVAEGKRRMTVVPRLLIEGAGGLLVPLTEQHMVADLAAAMKLPLLIVARAGLGTVNHTLLTIEAARYRGLTIAGVLLNGYREGEERAVDENILMIESFGAVRVWGALPQLDEEPVTPEEWKCWRAKWIGIMESRTRMDDIMAFF